MVVLVIIGLMTGAVMLTMSDPRGGVSNDIDRFAGRVRAARDSAIIAGRSVSLWVSPTGYGFERRAQGQWLSVNDGPLASQDWTGDTRAQLGSTTQIRIVFDSVGRADQPLRFALLHDGRQVALRMDLDGKVTSGE